MVGTSPEAELYAVKIADASGGGYTSAVIQGIDWAIENDINIINMSFVSDQYSEVFHEAIQRVAAAGIIIIAAAGNNGSGVDQLQCTLGTIGMVPVLGEGADAINGVMYLIRGDYLNAMLSAGAVIPVLGSFVTGGKKVAFTGAKHVERIYKSNPCGCVPEGTEIITKDGPKPIEQIQIGDLVLAKDTDTGKKTFKPVINLFNRENNEIYNLEIQGKKIQTTGNHPFWVKDNGWVTADELIPGDLLETETGAFIALQSVEVTNKESKVYNFEVEEFHTYYLSELALLTHNSTEACQLSNYSKIVPKKLTGRTSGAQSTILAAEITKATGLAKPYGWAAHHIIPYKPSNDYAVKLHTIMKKYNIDLNSSANGVFLPPATNKADTLIIDEYTISTHSGSHGISYYEDLYNMIRTVENQGADAVLEQIEIMREKLLTGQYQLYKAKN